MKAVLIEAISSVCYLLNRQEVISLTVRVHYNMVARMLPATFCVKVML
jgi:hypothetical protein